MFRHFTLECRLKYIWTEYVEDILTLLDSCNDRSLFLFQVWGPRLLPLAKLHMNSSSFGTWQVCKMPGFVKVCPFLSDLYRRKQNQIFIQLSFYLVLKENIGSFSKYCFASMKRVISNYHMETFLRFHLTAKQLSCKYFWILRLKYFLHRENFPFVVPTFLSQWGNYS